MADITTKLIKIKIKDIIPYENNAKLHDSNQLEAIRDSIISLGYLSRIEVDEKNIVLAGHGRLQSFKQLDSTGEKEIEVIQFTGLDEDQKKAYRIAHNKLTMTTGFDPDKLGKEFNLLEDTDYFGSTGFETKEISEIWDRPETSNLVEQEKSSTIEHTCPECHHVWQTEISNSRKRD